MGSAAARVVFEAGRRGQLSQLWGGRFQQGPSQVLWDLTVSTHFDRELLADDCSVLAHHAARLNAAGILSDDDLRSVSAVLEELAQADPATIITDEDEDVHSAVERVLLERLPDAAPRLRAGLSRNDRVASATRRWLDRALAHLRGETVALADTLAKLAAQHAAAAMPGYTHLQRAQPVTLGHHLAAHAWALLRDADRLSDAAGRASGEPLGAGALAGSTLPLPTPKGQLPNSLDAVSSRDHLAEALAAFAILGVHLSRIGEEIVLWTTTEFGFATLDDAWATGSSLMPQKKNPDVAELVRGKAGRLIGDLTSLLVTMKGLPLSYNRDLQEDKEPVFDAVKTLALALPAVRGMLETIAFDTEAMRAAADDPMLLATDLADALVAAGVPFRTAHELVGSAVVAATHAADPRESLCSDQELGTYLGGPEGVREILDTSRSIDARIGNGPGGLGAQLELLTAAVSARS
jgi:argininosuccinate lyase